jgi:hypothetical protein
MSETNVDWQLQKGLLTALDYLEQFDVILQEMETSGGGMSVLSRIIPGPGRFEPEPEIIAEIRAFSDSYWALRKKLATRLSDTSDYFGVCPTCRKTDGYVNVGRDHWFVCDEHRVRWCVGSNLFSSWRGETEAEQQAHWERVKGYDVISRSAPSPEPVGAANT